MSFKGGLLSVVAIVGLSATSTYLLSSSVSAAACTNVSTYGSVKLNVPTLPNDGEVNVWVRMQAETPNSKLLLELNDTECLEIGAINSKRDIWTWQTYKNVQDKKSIKFAESSGNSIKIIGINSGVRVDKILFTSKNCMPQDFGSNCVDAVSVNAAIQDEVSITKLTPPSTEPVSGEVEITNTPNQFVVELDRVEYIVDGKVVQTSLDPKPFDTTRVVNGKHTVLAETKLKNGQLIRESTVINVKNPLNPFSPIIRWVKINPNTFKVIVYSVLGFVSVVLLYLLARKFLIGRRHRRFHGF